MTIFLTDIANDFAPMNEVFREFFPNDPPARSPSASPRWRAPGC